MRVVTDSTGMTDVAAGFSDSGLRTGFVPTMGALHRGHLSLVEIAKRRSDRVVVSVFVNPSQFGPGEDFERYPRDLERDAALLEDAGADVLFAPSTLDLYGEGYSTWIDLPAMGEVLCGPSRPGHFRGVATVCFILFRIVRPAAAVFGRKDAQQLAIIRRMAADLRLGVEIVGAPIVREDDGLALSSRNVYLSGPERVEAARICRGLTAAAAVAAAGVVPVQTLRAAFMGEISGASCLSVQYADLVDPVTMTSMDTLDRDGLFAVAVHAGPTRLIDNFVLRPGVGAVEV
jgi:pantoate--beta-alanine ligase